MRTRKFWDGRRWPRFTALGSCTAIVWPTLSYYRWDDALQHAVITKTPVDIETEFGSELDEIEDENE
jgi:hypothetical protein